MKSTFKELCEANLESADYHALCQTARAVYLSEFRADEFDCVRRFITLTDLAYESKTRIVCLSSVPLFKLFAKIVPSGNRPAERLERQLEEISVRREGGSSSSMMSTFIREIE